MFYKLFVNAIEEGIEESGFEGESGLIFVK